MENVAGSNYDGSGPPPPMPATEGWKFDPFGRFEARRWDGSAWTTQVLHNGCLEDDPAPLTDPGRWFAEARAREEEARRTAIPRPVTSTSSTPPPPPPPPPNDRWWLKWALVTAAVILVTIVVATGSLGHLGLDTSLWQDEKSDSASQTTAPPSQAAAEQASDSSSTRLRAGVVLALWVLCAVAGLLIGAAKGRGVAGFFLGFLLGIIGIIITVFLRPARR
jgi:hypothetical protein